MKEEHQTKNNVEVDYGCNSVVPQPHFLFSLISLQFLLILKVQPLPQPLSRLFIGHEGTWWTWSSLRLIRQVGEVLIFTRSLSQSAGLASHPLSETFLG
ncbi:hypothetical protein GmHk_14G041727 [Glycine max]|nr:hypothetical protein GmHk_14G041727 [Glycine max]